MYRFYLFIFLSISILAKEQIDDKETELVKLSILDFSNQAGVNYEYLSVSISDAVGIKLKEVFKYKNFGNYTL